MSSVRNRFVWPLVVWTLVVWVPRIRNVWSDDDLSTAGQVGRTLLATSFVVSALVVARVSWHARSRAFTARERGAVLGLAAWTIGVWVVRGGQILLGDHDAAFTAVHSVLAIVSILLAGSAVRVGFGRDEAVRGSLAESVDR